MSCAKCGSPRVVGSDLCHSHGGKSFGEYPWPPKESAITIDVNLDEKLTKLEEEAKALNVSAMKRLEDVHKTLETLKAIKTDLINRIYGYPN